MKYGQAYRFLMPKLEQELPVYLAYHNVQHTKDVLQVAEHLCEAENIPGSEKELLLTAVLFHDSGFIKGYNNHEEQSCEIARQALPAFDYSKVDIDTICDLIIATRSFNRPTTLLQKIIYDANLHYLGTPHYFAYSNKLYIEYKHQNLVRDREDWHKKQLSFLEGHEYMTRSAIRKYSSLKKQNLQLLTTKRKPSKRQENKMRRAAGDWTLIGLGALSASYGLNGYLVPNNFFDGGVSGIALLLHEIYHFDLSVLIILLNLPIIILSYFGTGKGFAIKTVVAIALLSICLYFIPFPVATTDHILVAVFGGFFIGLGSGLAIRGVPRLMVPKYWHCIPLKKQALLLVKLF